MTTTLRRCLAAGLAVGVTGAALAAIPDQDGPRRADTAVTLAAASQGATVLTLEGGLVGIQPFFQFTPRQLQGSLCQAPDTCRPVYYFAMPLGAGFNKAGAAKLTDAIAGLPAGSQVRPFGHSQGGQVIYAAVRDWVANPGAETTPDPSQISWVSIGNPENAFGGTKKQDGLPPDTPYHGIEVIKQYDGWADAPDGPFNLLSWLNAQIGKSTTHVFGYFDIDLDAPENIRYTPEQAPGVPGNITYVFVPNDTLPLIEMTGIFAPLLNPILDPILRPIVESGYDRPIGPVGPAAGQPVRPAAVSVFARRAAHPFSAPQTAAAAVPASAPRRVLRGQAVPAPAAAAPATRYGTQRAGVAHRDRGAAASRPSAAHRERADAPVRRGGVD